MKYYILIITITKVAIQGGENALYRVMIVDDEVAVREKISQIIRFENYGFTVCGSAKNGRDALNKLAEVHPDLILLDIRMPVLDGIGFLEELRKSDFAQTKVIILSGYSDFEYARKAVHFGAKGYLTKPVDENEAHDRLREIAGELDKREKEQGRAEVRRQVDHLKQVYHSAGNVGLKRDYALLFVVALSSQAICKQISTHEIISTCLDEVLGQAEDYLLRVRGGIYTYLLPTRIFAEQGPEAFGRALLCRLEKRQLDCVALIDSVIFTSPSDSYRHDYSTHLHAMLTDVFFGRKGVVCYPPQSLLSKEDRIFAEDYFLMELRNGLLMKSRVYVIEKMHEMISEVRRASLGMELIQELNYRIYYMLLEVMSSVMAEKKMDEPILPSPEWRDYPNFLTGGRWESMQIQQIVDAYDFIERCRKISHMGVCGEVLEYVHRHFNETLSIKQVAEQFSTNPAYLGRVFQRATGISFNQYVNDLRIAQAKRLLCQTNKLVYEVAELTGFSQSKYFISKFTKEVGQSPTEYRKEHA